MIVRKIVQWGFLFEPHQQSMALVFASNRFKTRTAVKHSMYPFIGY